jgi:hypothetical protein
MPDTTPSASFDADAPYYRVHNFMRLWDQGATLASYEGRTLAYNDLADVLDLASGQGRREAVAALERAERERNTAYRERAQLVALLAALYPSHIGHTDPDAPDWAVVTIQAPTGQMCWHVAPSDMDLFGHVQRTPHYARGWDGHTTEEKYGRVRELIRKVRNGEERQPVWGAERDPGPLASLPTGPLHTSGGAQ